MKSFKLFLVLFLLTNSFNAHAETCLQRKDMRSYNMVSSNEIDYYNYEEHVSVKVKMDGACSRPSMGSFNLSYESKTGDLYSVCVGDRVVVSIYNINNNPVRYASCRIVSMQSN